MSKRFSSFISRKKRDTDRDLDASLPPNGFLAAEDRTAPYSGKQEQNGNTAAAAPAAYPTTFTNVQPAYRVHNGPPPNPRDPRTNVPNPLPYPATPRPFPNIPQNGLNTHAPPNMRDRTPSNPSSAHSYGSNPDYILVSSPPKTSPPPQSASPADSLNRVSPGPAPMHGRHSELPVPGGAPYMPLSDQAFFQQDSGLRGPFTGDRHPHQHPSRAPPKPPSAPHQRPAAQQQPQQQPQQPQPPQQPQHYPHEEVPSPPLGQTSVSSEKLRLQRRNNTSKTYIRQLRHLIREKYRLDVSIWSNRDVIPADRDIIKDDCVKADAAMQEILQIIHHWEEDLFDPEEWRVAKKIKEGILKHSEHYKQWTELPPWDRPVVSEEPAVGDVTAAVGKLEL